ncbi:MAG: hypothetical protein O7F09_06560, partial [Chloroflexi bacterium]|nr:hypothetical protein [Chloroflexota bacterium]
GGIAFILDEDGSVNQRYYPEMVDLEQVVEASDIATLKGLMEEHRRLTGSSVAARVLDAWDSYLPRFIKIMPRDYQRVLAERAARGELTLEPELVHHG